MNTTPAFEIPSDMYKITEKSLEQVQVAINNYLQFLRRTVPDSAMGGSEVSDRVLGYAQRNVTAAFGFAQRLAQVRDLQQLTGLQMEFIQAQMQALTVEAKELGETITKMAMDVAKNPAGNRPTS
jgi:hypothetical protein